MQLPKISILITLMICLVGVNPAMAEPGDYPLTHPLIFRRRSFATVGTNFD